MTDEEGPRVKTFGFSRRQRLTTNSQIKAVLARRFRQTDGLLVLYRAENALTYARLGVSVGRSCGEAVARNRLKRLLRESFRLSQDQIPTGFDYVLMMSRAGLGRTDGGAKGLTLQRVRRSFEDLIRKGSGRPGRPMGGLPVAPGPCSPDPG
jgi:ribonuclease P protein component